MENIKLTIAYDGTLYLGWQKSKQGPSVEGTLQKSIEQILQHPVVLQAASRTDAGVHANGQVVNFFTPQLLAPEKFVFSLNRLLPKDVIVSSAEKMERTFHPTIDCIEKEYRYYICYGKTQHPIHRHYSWHFPYDFCIDTIEKALPLFLGEHDFESFCNTKTTQKYTHFNRTIYSLNLLPIEKNRLCFCIRGRHFLYKMVRNIVGTLMLIGRGKISIDQISDIFSCKKRTAAGITAPAHGLFLEKIFFLPPEKNETPLFN